MLVPFENGSAAARISTRHNLMVFIVPYSRGGKHLAVRAERDAIKALIFSAKYGVELPDLMSHNLALPSKSPWLAVHRQGVRYTSKPSLYVGKALLFFPVATSRGLRLQSSFVFASKCTPRTLTFCCLGLKRGTTNTFLLLLESPRTLPVLRPRA